MSWCTDCSTEGRRISATVMRSARLLQACRAAASNRLTRVAIGHTVLVALAAFQLNAQSAGSIASHRIPEMGVAVIDSQQNVYIAGGGGCAGGISPGGPVKCPPMVIVKAAAAGSTVFSYSDNINGTSPSSLAVDSAGEVFVIGTRLTVGAFAAGRPDRLPRQRVHCWDDL